MADLHFSENPYASPVDDRVVITWWDRLRSLFLRTVVIDPPKFEDGAAIIVGGIAFFINPNQSGLLYAASPSEDVSDRRMNLIIAESFRMLPHFLREGVDLHALLRGRGLCVQIVFDYTGCESRVKRQVMLEWDIVGALLEVANSDEDLLVADVFPEDDRL